MLVRRGLRMIKYDTNGYRGLTFVLGCLFVQAEADMELLLMKHKQLQQQWNSSLMTIAKQSEALYAMQEAVR